MATISLKAQKAGKKKDSANKHNTMNGMNWNL